MNIADPIFLPHADDGESRPSSVSSLRSTGELSLHRVLMRLALLQREAVDRLSIQDAIAGTSGDGNERARLLSITRRLHVAPARWQSGPDMTNVPALAYDATGGYWGILRGRDAQGAWVSEWPRTDGGWDEQADADPSALSFASLRLQPTFSASRSPVMRLIVEEILQHKGLLAEAALGGLVITALMTVTSFYSMQLYDRVIPSGAQQTLLVLTLGVLGAVLFELTARRVRSGLYESLIDHVDRRLARLVYGRFLAIRLEQIPSDIGTLATQLRGYEYVRGFLVNLTTQLLVDAPFALALAGAIAFIAGPLALIPAAFFFIALGLGAWQSAHLRTLAQRGHTGSGQRTGLLVETLEGAEIIKSTQGGWRMLTQWLANTDDAREVDLHMRRASEHVQHLIAAFQQVAYILTMAFGTLLVMDAHLTTGALMACAILSGRVLGPCAQMMGQIIAWGHAKAALQGLDRIWRLEGDHDNEVVPVVLEHVRGSLRFDNAELHLGGRLALKVPALTIRPGERIAVLGPVGSGKTSLLRLISGMYRPQVGRVLLDDIDLSEIAKPSLSDNIGYLPQDGRLLAGTLRDNIILGLMDPGDEAILEAARITGLLDAVISPHPQGLQQRIREGGTGLSGGQRQLVHLTRVLLRRPKIWLLDEPTASLDQGTEKRAIAALNGAMRPDDTLILTTHKAELLHLVSRVLVVSNHQVVLDGPRDDVLARLQAPSHAVSIQPAMRHA